MSSKALALRSSKRQSRKKNKSQNQSSQFGSQSLFKPILGPKPLITKNAFPNVFRTCMAYNEQFTAAPSGGSSDGYVISVQSVYDPRFASGGHQPQYFDQIAALWTYFVVRRVRLRLTVVPDNDPAISGSTTNNVYQGCAFIAPFTSTTGTRASAASSDMQEWPGAVVQPVQTSGGNAQIGLEIDLPRYFGMPWRIYRAIPAFWGTNGGNPSTMVVFAWMGAIAQASGAPIAMLCNATIEYDVEFFVPQTLATS